MEITFEEIYDEFLLETGIDRTKVVDYRPCIEFFKVPNIPFGIVIWFKSGNKVIYIHKT